MRVALLLVVGLAAMASGFRRKGPLPINILWDKAKIFFWQTSFTLKLLLQEGKELPWTPKWEDCWRRSCWAKQHSSPSLFPIFRVPRMRWLNYQRGKNYLYKKKVGIFNAVKVDFRTTSSLLGIVVMVPQQAALPLLVVNMTLPLAAD